MNRIRIITGPMFAGKTTELLHRIRNDGIHDANKLIFNFKGDRRYTEDGSIASHNYDTIPAYSIGDCMEIEQYVSSKTEIIYIDEVQFMSSVEKWINHFKQHINDNLKTNQYNNIKHIVLCGLNLDVYGNNFNNEFTRLLNDIPFEHIKYLKSKCYKCNYNADFTVLVNKYDTTDNIENIENNITTNIENNNSNHVQVGSSDIYQPVCLEHAIKANYTHNFNRFIPRY